VIAILTGGLAMLSFASVPADLAATVGRHCLNCHDHEDGRPDLSTLPAEADRAAWLKIFSMIESRRMPPPKEDGPAEARFPLDPLVRAKMLESIAQILGDALDPPLGPRRISNRAWLNLVSRVAEPVIDGAAIKKLLATGSARFGVPPNEPSAPYEIVLDRASHEVCAAIAHADAAMEPPNQKYLAGLTAKGRPSSKAKEEAARRLFEAVYRAPPEVSETQDAVRLLDRAWTATRDWDTAWVILCTSFLAGPKLQYTLEAATAPPASALHGSR
jgi:hypothetical protein